MAKEYEQVYNSANHLVLDRRWANRCLQLHIHGITVEHENPMRRCALRSVFEVERVMPIHWLPIQRCGLVASEQHVRLVVLECDTTDALP